MTPENIKAIIAAVSQGLVPKRAAMAVGVNPVTMRNHLRRDRDFATAIKRAEAEAESGLWSRLMLHTEKQWTAIAWMLERRWPERYAKREHIEVGDSAATFAKMIREAQKERRAIDSAEDK